MSSLSCAVPVSHNRAVAARSAQQWQVKIRWFAVYYAASIAGFAALIAGERLLLALL